MDPLLNQAYRITSVKGGHVIDSDPFKAGQKTQGVFAAKDTARSKVTPDSQGWLFSRESKLSQKSDNSEESVFLKIRQKQSELVLTDSTDESDHSVTLKLWNHQGSQLWTVQENENGRVCIENVQTGRVLVVNDSQLQTRKAAASEDGNFVWHLDLASVESVVTEDLSTKTSVNNTLKSLAESAAGHIPEVGGLISGLLGFFWPENDPMDEVWTKLRRETEKLIDTKLLHEYMTSAKERLVGLKETLQQFKRAKNMEKGACMAVLLGKCQDLYAVTSTRDDAIHLLPVLATLAHIHLSALRERLVNGHELYPNDRNYVEWEGSLRTTYDRYCDSVNNLLTKWKKWRELRITLNKKVSKDLTHTISDITYQLTDEVTGFTLEFVDGQSEEVCKMVRTKRVNDAIIEMMSALSSTSYLRHYLAPYDRPKLEPVDAKKSSQDVSSKTELVHILKTSQHARAKTELVEITNTSQLPSPKPEPLEEMVTYLAGPYNVFTAGKIRISPSQYGGSESEALVTSYRQIDYAEVPGTIESILVRSGDLVDAMEVRYATHSGTVFGQKLGGEPHVLDFKGKDVLGARMSFVDEVPHLHGILAGISFYYAEAGGREIKETELLGNKIGRTSLLSTESLALEGYRVSCISVQNRDAIRQFYIRYCHLSVPDKAFEPSLLKRGHTITKDCLTPGLFIISKNGRYRFEFRLDGELVLLDLDKIAAAQPILWRSMATCDNPLKVELVYSQLTVYAGTTAKSVPVWKYGRRTGTEMSTLYVTDEGEVLVKDAQGVVTKVIHRTISKLPENWLMEPGDQLISDNRRYRLCFQSDGNLVLYDVQSGEPAAQQNLVIESASYESGTSDKRQDVTQKVRDLASAATRAVTISASNKVFGDPALNEKKKLVIHYRLGGRVAMISVPEDEKITLPVIAPGRAIWATNATHYCADKLLMKGDGNLIITANGHKVWDAGVQSRKTINSLVVTDYGSLLLRGKLKAEDTPVTYHTVFASIVTNAERNRSSNSNF